MVSQQAALRMFVKAVNLWQQATGETRSEAIRSLTRLAFRGKSRMGLNRRKTIEILVTDMDGEGMTQRQIAAELNRMGLSTPRGKQWQQGQIARILKKKLEDHSHKGKPE